MKKYEADTYRIVELEYLGTERGSSVAMASLKARIARRPGRWRQRMQSRRYHLDDAVHPYNEAA